MRPTRDHDGCHACTSRRELLARGAFGLGSLALSTLLAEDARAQRGQPVLPHFRPRAKRVLWLHMAGGPSQMDLFDPKPKLNQLDRQPCPEELYTKDRFAFIEGVPKLLGSPYRFAPAGESGAQFSELVPHLAGVADELCIVRSMRTTQFNHAPGQIFMSTGHERIGRPSMGSWISYGLGSENRDLPAFVVLTSGKYAPDGGNALWSSGFLPTVHQGVRLRSTGDPVLFLSNPPGLDVAARRRSLDAVRALNEKRAAETGDPEIETRIAQYELAFRMQTSVPELADLASEPAEVRELYGYEPGEPSYAANCLLARRLLERGVRFVQLYHWGWDSHGTGPHDDIVTSLPERARECDRASAALILDLARLGLLEDTIVFWGGEFGRTPMNEERDGSKFLGRDHHPHCFTVLLAGGGFRSGACIGATDELGYHVTEDPISVHDLHATMLHQLGIDHTKLTYFYQGRDFRLTDVEGVVVEKLLA
jgi:hypothetical protein